MYRGYENDVLDGLFPPDVATAWADPAEAAKPLFPEEAALVAGAVAKRRQQFAKGRECARAALASLGFGEFILLAGESREPLWPTGVVGSITHTIGFCAAAIAPARRYAGIGIDAEPAEALAPAVAKRVFGEQDSVAATVSSLDPSLVPRLVFSAKEAVYKCQFPVSRKYLGFDAVEVEIEERTFRARLRVEAPPFPAGTLFAGRWQHVGGHLMTSAWLGVPDRSPEPG